jgi:UDP-glucuronate decarboxylase
MSKQDFAGPVNLGNPREFTILSLARKIIELTKSKSEIVFNSLPSDDPVQRQPDISLAKTRLSWTPRIEIEEGLKRTIDYFEGIVG